MWMHVIQKQIIILKYSDSKENLYCTPVVLLYCAMLVSPMAYRGSLQVFKKFHLLKRQLWSKTLKHARTSKSTVTKHLNENICHLSFVPLPFMVQQEDTAKPTYGLNHPFTPKLKFTWPEGEPAWGAMAAKAVHIGKGALVWFPEPANQELR